ncbi:MAG: PII family protein [Clostridiaceae bacterium BRH_c20a]|nr:MAG: PII family protein [Clostridiaceae bacterium BRH_c20a]
MHEHLIINHKLLVVIVNKGTAKKIVKACKENGAEGATTLIGNGTAQKFWGLNFEPEKEIIFILITEKLKNDILNTIIKAACLDKSGQGVAFVLDIKGIAGICHICNSQGSTIIESGRSKMGNNNTYDLIVTIVNKGDSELVVEASKKAGAQGGTIMNGRGTGIHEQAKLFGLVIEPEKEVVLTLIKKESTEDVIEAITKEAQLNVPGRGIAFILPVDQVEGINH